MIVGIEGKVEKKEPTRVLINCNGIIYEVHISLNCSNSIKSENIKLLITQIIREDAWSLYGFLEQNEKKMFDTLIKINGIGPKVAIAICSTYTPESFFKIVENKDAKALEKVPGIGTKSAGRIIVELAGFGLDLALKNNQNQTINETVLALESLGFKMELIQKVLQTCTSTTTPELVKEALKKLQGIR